MQGDNGVFENQYQESEFEQIAHPAEAALLGGYIGHKLDQTRFGRWFNKNQVIDLIYVEVAKIIVVAVVIAILWFLFLVLI